LLTDLLERVAGCFPRRETRQCCGQMVRGLLMELKDHNCWTIAEAVGHCGRTGCSTCYPVRSGTTSGCWISRWPGQLGTSMTETRC
jgi:hypothetical protein